MKGGLSRDHLLQMDFTGRRLENVEAHFGLSRDAITGEGGSSGAEAIGLYEFAVNSIIFSRSQQL
jgi:hypothetical protein